MTGSPGRWWSEGLPGGVGLCAACRHRRVVVTSRGSRFHLCERSREDPGFPRYPPLPVLRCRGFEPIEEARGDPGE